MLSICSDGTNTTNDWLIASPAKNNTKSLIKVFWKTISRSCKPWKPGPKRTNKLHYHAKTDKIIIENVVK